MFLLIIFQRILTNLEIDSIVNGISSYQNNPLFKKSNISFQSKGNFKDNKISYTVSEPFFSPISNEIDSYFIFKDLFNFCFLK